jgi:hypothetical protein
VESNTEAYRLLFELGEARSKAKGRPDDARAAETLAAAVKAVEEVADGYYLDWLSDQSR